MSSKEFSSPNFRLSQLSACSLNMTSTSNHQQAEVNDNCRRVSLAIALTK
ncbi:MAG: hypothetical protein F6K25_31710 [Okeania sp. SIO2G4]|nr:MULTISPECIES: hypothetical protein [unclassified Okeania]NEP04954.1 hypothetical protein [Okeania sp. SIO4D6]NEP40152.1 hypothetical protein [Okeania sp. SIO2H7]NEP76045.1 hypothetical protein [Okeania sp. SIO2G5]NEP97230.1 hypothetical protein [Okeania sp. SIO2F5]NEQ94943.1 hypothetical protein [Okeania sp. SIO2G4]